MNIKEFFHENLNYYDDNDKLVSENSFAKDTLHMNFESFEEAFDAAIANNLEIYHCDNPSKLRVGFMVVNADKKNVARYFMRLGTFKRAGMLEGMVKYRNKKYEDDNENNVISR